MKKSAILIFLILTIAFASFVAGFYWGRNYQIGDVHIQGFPVTSAPTQTPSTTKQPQTTISTPDSSSVPLLININTATLEQLDLLPGIGPVTAQAIIDYRTEFGPFETPEDLLHVKGIGEKKLAAILDFITTGG
ncbi:MAG: ComEA family DNA-binding protein [Oscillospiraceae bacterium]|nr:ComEA family DNA-binding protein [Oscillospiraceae bacterium]